MKNMFLCLENALKKEKDAIKIDIKENFNFFSKNYSNFYQLIKKVEDSKRIYEKEEKDLVSLKNDLYNKSHQINQINEEVDLSKLLPKNTEATLEMKKNYGYFLNRINNEFDRMKGLNNDIFKNNIMKCFKLQFDILNGFKDKLNEILSKIKGLENPIKINNAKNRVVRLCFC